MLRAYCIEHQNEWDQRIPFVLFAAHDSVQESLGFSPFEMVFRHPVRGPHKLIKEQWVDDQPLPNTMTDYMSKIRKMLTDTHKLAQSYLQNSQKQMKAIYDKKAVRRNLKRETKSSFYYL